MRGECIVVLLDRDKTTLKLNCQVHQIGTTIHKKAQIRER